MNIETAQLIQMLAAGARDTAGTEASAVLLKEIERLAGGEPKSLTAIEHVAYETSVTNAAEFKRQLQRLGELDLISQARGMSTKELSEFTSLLQAWHPEQQVEME